MWQRCQRWGLQYVALLIVVPALSGLLLLVPGQRQSQPGMVCVRLGYSPNLAHMQALVGLTEGTFIDQLGRGATIVPRALEAEDDIVAALQAGDLDLAYVGPAPAIAGYQQRRALRVIAGAATGGSRLVARKEVRGLADLLGRRVVVPPGSTEEVLLRALLRQERMTGRVTVTTAAGQGLIAAFSSGKADAACVPEPWASRLVQEAGARVLLDDRQVCGGREYPAACVVASDAFLRDHADLARRWLAAHRELTDRLQRREPGDMIALNAALRGLTGKALPGSALFAAARRIHCTTDPMPAGLEALGKVAWQAGCLTAPPNLQGLVAPPPSRCRVP